MFDYYKNLIASMTTFTDWQLEKLVDEMAFDERLTNEEYSALYAMVVEIARA